MSPDETASPEAEHKNHRYTGYVIPWFIHMLWVLFWIFAIGYMLRYLFPAIQGELKSPP